MTVRRIALVWALLPSLLPAILLWGSLTGRAVPSFRDQSDFFYPMHRYTAQRLLARELPLWNALAGNGEPWIANGQNEIFYPPALSFLIRNGAVAVGIFLAFHFLAAYLLFFGFLRARDISPGAAAAGASLYAFSGVSVSFSVFWNHFAGAAWIPGMAWAAQLGLKTRRHRIGFATATAMALLAGSPEAALFGLLLSGLVFGLERSAEVRARLETGTTAVRRPGAFALAAAWGIAISAVELAPFLEGLRRGAARTSIVGGGASFRQILSLVVVPSASPTPWLPEGSRFLQTFYVSLPLLLAAAGAGLLPERKTEKRWWALTALAGLTLALLPIPVPFRYPAKLAWIFLFALALLAAEGIDALRFAPPSRGRKQLGIAFAAVALPAAVLLARTPAERGSLVLGAVLLAGAALDGSAARRGLLASGASAALAVHLLAAGLPLRRQASLATVEAPPRPAHGKVLTTQDEFLSDWSSAALPSEEGRVRRQIESLEGYTNLPFGIAKARTASALPSREEQIFTASLANVADLTKPAAAAGCGEVRFPEGETVARVIVRPTLSGASFFFREELAPVPERAFAAIASGRFDFHHILYVERAGGVGPPGRITALARTVSESAERIEYTATLSQAAWLFRAQSWDPWWTASLDGAPAEIVRANGIFSAVLVPAGEHRIVWRYRPWPFYAGAAVSILAILCCAWAALTGEPIPRRRPV